MATTKVVVTGTQTGVSFPLHIDGSQVRTVRQVKKFIKQETGTDVKNQILFLSEGNNCSYVADDTLVDAHYPTFNLAFYKKVPSADRIELMVDVQGITPKVKAAEEFRVRMMPNSTLLRLRELLDERTGVPPRRQTIVLDLGKRSTLSIEPDELGEVALSQIMPDGIKGILLKMEPRNPARSVLLTVVAQQFNVEIELKVELHRDTINSLKTEVLTKLAKVVKHATDKSFLLKTNNRYLSEGALTLEQSQVEANQILYLVQHHRP